MLNRNSIFFFLCMLIFLFSVTNNASASYSYDGVSVSHTAKAIYTFIGCIFLLSIGAGAYLTEGAMARRTLIAIAALSTFLGGMTVFSQPSNSDDNYIIAIFLSLPAIGFIGSFIFSSHIFSSMPKFKAGLFSSVSGAIAYMLTHAFVGFGVTEASFSAIGTAVILGALGYASD